MKTEETIESVNKIYQNNFQQIIIGFRENNDINELSYDIEEVFDENNTLGDLMDFFVDNEKCEIWDIPYLTYLIINSPSQVYTYFS